jgi:hypothetical protein
MAFQMVASGYWCEIGTIFIRQKQTDFWDEDVTFSW